MGQFTFIAIAFLVGGGEIRDRVTPEECLQIQALELRALKTGVDRWVYNPKTRVKSKIREFRCFPIEEAPSS